MLEGFHLATEQEIKGRIGIVYLIAFGDGSFYIGSTGQSFRKRYGANSLRASRLIANPSIQHRLDKGIDYKVFMHSQSNMNDVDRQALEDALISEHIKSGACLNMMCSGENFGTRRACTLKSPNGSVVDFESVGEACEFIGASNHSQVSQVLNGRMLSVCGWTLPETVGPVGVNALKKTCVLVDPSGNLVEFDSYGAASAAIGVNQNGIGSLVNGMVTTIKGWTIPGKPGRKYIPVKLISPLGKKLEFASRLDASKAIGCSNQLVSQLCTGKARHAKGWKLAETPRLRVGR